MTIVLKNTDFDLIMKSCKNIVGKHPNEVLTQIKLTSFKGAVVAEALNGVQLIRVQVPCEPQSDEGVMLIPLCTPVGCKASYVWLCTDKDTVTVSTEVLHTQYKAVRGVFPDTDKLFPSEEPICEMYFDTKVLIGALSAFKSSKFVKLEIRGAEKSLVLSSKYMSGLALPLNPKKFPHKEATT